MGNVTSNVNNSSGNTINIRTARSVGQHQTKSLPDFKELSKGKDFTTKELEDFFKTFKEDFPGERMNKKQFIELHMKMFVTVDEGCATDFCDHVFRQYDKDNSGSIDFREFVATMSFASKGTPQEKLRWAFQLYDKDNSGYLIEVEIVEILSTIYKSRGLPDAKGKATVVARDVFSKADDSKDNKLSEAEFVQHSSSYAEVVKLLESF